MNIEEQKNMNQIQAILRALEVAGLQDPAGAFTGQNTFTHWPQSEDWQPVYRAFQDQAALPEQSGNDTTTDDETLTHLIARAEALFASQLTGQTADAVELMTLLNRVQDQLAVPQQTAFFSLPDFKRWLGLHLAALQMLQGTANREQHCAAVWQTGLDYIERATKTAYQWRARQIHIVFSGEGDDRATLHCALQDKAVTRSAWASGKDYDDLFAVRETLRAELATQFVGKLGLREGFRMLTTLEANFSRASDQVSVNTGMEIAARLEQQTFDVFLERLKDSHAVTAACLEEWRDVDRPLLRTTQPFSPDAPFAPNLYASLAAPSVRLFDDGGKAPSLLLSDLEDESGILEESVGFTISLLGELPGGSVAGYLGERFFDWLNAGPDKWEAAERRIETFVEKSIEHEAKGRIRAKLFTFHRLRRELLVSVRQEEKRHGKIPAEKNQAFAARAAELSENMLTAEALILRTGMDNPEISLPYIEEYLTLAISAHRLPDLYGCNSGIDFVQRRIDTYTHVERYFDTVIQNIANRRAEDFYIYVPKWTKRYGGVYICDDRRDVQFKDPKNCYMTGDVVLGKARQWALERVQKLGALVGVGQTCRLPLLTIAAIADQDCEAKAAGYSSDRLVGVYQANMTRLNQIWRDTHTDVDNFTYTSDIIMNVPIGERHSHALRHQKTSTIETPDITRFYRAENAMWRPEDINQPPPSPETLHVSLPLTRRGSYQAD